MTAHELIQHEYRTNPGRSALATNASRTAVAAWDEKQGRWVIVAGTAIDHPDEWYSMEHELLINGKPPNEEWVPVPPAHAGKKSGIESLRAQLHAAGQFTFSGYQD